MEYQLIYQKLRIVQILLKQFQIIVYKNLCLLPNQAQIFLVLRHHKPHLMNNKKYYAGKKFDTVICQKKKGVKL